MVKIPIYDQRVTPNANAGNTPAMPTAPSEAFGQELSKAGARLGETLTSVGEKLGQHLQVLQDRDNKKQVLDLETKFRQEIQNNLYSTEIGDDQKPIGLLNRNLGGAKGGTKDFDGRYQKLSEKYMQMAGNDYQRDLLKPLIQNAYETARGNVIGHEANESNKDFSNTVDNNIKQKIQDAAGLTDTEQLKAAIGSAVSIGTDGYKKQGFDDKTIAFNNSQIAFGMAKSSVTAMLEKDTKQARAIFEGVKDYLSDDAKVALNSTIKGKEMLDLSRNVYQQTTGMKLADGNPDTAKMEQYVFTLPNTTTEDKEKIWDYVKTKASEDKSQKAMNDDANDRQFMNNLYNNKKSGKTMDDSLALVGQYGRDAYDKGLKEKAVKDLYTKNIQSDPLLKVKYWEGIRDGNVTQDMLDGSYKNDQLSASDWESLRKDLYNETHKGASGEAKMTPEMKSTYDRVKILANETFPGGDNSVEKAKFLYSVQDKMKTANPDEVWTYAQTSLKNQGEKSWLIFHWGGEKGFKSDLGRIDANRDVWGKFYTDIGRDEVRAIGASIQLNKGRKKWSVDDLNEFIKDVGGYDQMKKGTPTHNAIQSMAKSKILITPDTIKIVLKQYPDGVF